MGQWGESQRNHRGVLAIVEEEVKNPAEPIPQQQPTPMEVAERTRLWLTFCLPVLQQQELPYLSMLPLKIGLAKLVLSRTRDYCLHAKCVKRQGQLEAQRTTARYEHSQSIFLLQNIMDLFNTSKDKLPAFSHT